MSEVVITEKTQPKPGKAQPFDWHKFAIAHDDLLAKELPPITYLVEDLISTPGLGILAAPKKRMKSWMALQLSQAVSSGAPFLGKNTMKGPVIHMALEDGERRLKQRLKMQNATPGLPITYIYKFEALNSKLGRLSLVSLVSEKRPVLTVIDTLAAAKNRQVDENSAGDTADLFNWLHELAISQNTVILVIAHHGKAIVGDAGFDIRGSSAIPGATDVNIGLYKNPDGTCDLKAEGRDIGEVELRISFDAEITWCWKNEGDARDIRRVEAEQRIIDTILLLGNKVDANGIAEETGLTRATIQTHLKRMREEGTVEYELVPVGKVKKIIYSVSPTSSTSSSSTYPQHRLHINNGVDDVGDSVRKKVEANYTHGVDDVGDDDNTPDYPFHSCPECHAPGDYKLNGKNQWVCPNGHIWGNGHVE